MPPSTQGQWLGAVQTPGDSKIVGDGRGVFVIHATLLRTGKVLWFSGHAESIHYLGESWIWDPTQPASTAVRQAFPSHDEDLFCGHHAVLDDGRVIVVGGATSAHGDNIDGTGIKAICVIDPAAPTPAWTRIGEMAHGRWYPTLVTLPDGRLVAFSGHRELGVGGISPTVELFSPPFTGPGYTTVTLAGGDKLFPTYPGLHLVRGGAIFHTGPTWRYEPMVVPDPIGTWSFRVLTPTTAAWTDHGISPNVDLREEGTSVLLPPAQDGRILVVGGAKAASHSLTANLVAGCEPRAAEILDTRSSPPAWTRIADMTHPRINVSAVLLPDGKVLVLGGHDRYKFNSASVNSNAAELYDPVLNTWTVAAAMSESRTYHSAALLLPNGSVIVAGGVDPTQTEDGFPIANRKTFEIYQPPYFFNGTRPSIISVTGLDVPADQIAYGGAVDIDVDVPAADIRKVVLMRPGSMTHHTDTEQRFVPLDFVIAGANRVRAGVINDASVAPPGFYMLWVVDAMNRPCQQARFIRLMRQQSSVLIDKSHYSSDEVGVSGANFTESFFVIMDGFTPGELGLPAGAVATPAEVLAAAPSISFHRAADDTTITTITAAATGVIVEETPPPAGLRQRFAFKYTLTIANRDIFFQTGGTIPIEAQNVVIRATKNGFTCRGSVTLNHQPNPFMIDGATPWLSVDLRVFKLTQDGNLFGRNVGATPDTALTFIQNVLTDFNMNPAAARTSFETTIPPEQDTPLTKLDILESRGGQRIFNFAIAQVRYRGQSLPATDVRVFFRAFTTAATNMDFRPETYPTMNNPVGAPIPVLGLQGGAVATIPFFATERVNSSFQRLDEQTDPPNRSTIAPTSGETTAYFGCWLDFNQGAFRYPLYPGSNVGPWSSGLQSLQQHVRGKHQCLVAEVHFPAGDPIPPNASPGGHDNLSQRNLAIDESDNPGGPASHRVQHTFEVRPSTGWAPAVAAYPTAEAIEVPAFTTMVGPQQLLLGDGCDELMFLWGNLPRESRVTLYLPDCNIDEILELAARRAGPQRLEKVDDATIRCELGDVTYVPLPGGRATNIPGLLTIELPAGVRKRQEFRVVVRQFDAFRRAIIGSFEFRIPVRTAPEILLEQQETLAVMKHIALSIPPTDRWYLIFNRYILQLGEKVRALGGNPDAVQPSPDDSGVPGAGERGRLCCTLFWTNAVLLAFAIALLAWSRLPAGRASFALFALLFVVFLVVWAQRCRPSLCSVLRMLLIGGVIGMGLLALFVLGGLAPPVPFGILGVLLVLLAVIAVAKVARRCVQC